MLAQLMEEIEASFRMDSEELTFISERLMQQRNDFLDIVLQRWFATEEIFRMYAESSKISPKIIPKTVIELDCQMDYDLRDKSFWKIELADEKRSQIGYRYFENDAQQALLFTRHYHNLALDDTIRFELEPDYREQNFIVLRNKNNSNVTLLKALTYHNSTANMHNPQRTTAVYKSKELTLNYNFLDNNCPPGKPIIGQLEKKELANNFNKGPYPEDTFSVFYKLFSAITERVLDQYKSKTEYVREQLTGQKGQLKDEGDKLNEIIEGN